MNPEVQPFASQKSSPEEYSPIGHSSEDYPTEDHSPEEESPEESSPEELSPSEKHFCQQSPEEQCLQGHSPQGHPTLNYPPEPTWPVSDYQYHMEYRCATPTRYQPAILYHENPVPPPSNPWHQYPQQDWHYMSSLPSFPFPHEPPVGNYSNDGPISLFYPPQISGYSDPAQYQMYPGNAADHNPLRPDPPISFQYGHPMGSFSNRGPSWLPSYSPRIPTYSDSAQYQIHSGKSPNYSPSRQTLIHNRDPEAKVFVGDLPNQLSNRQLKDQLVEMFQYDGKRCKKACSARCAVSCREHCTDNCSKVYEQDRSWRNAWKITPDINIAPGIRKGPGRHKELRTAWIQYKKISDAEKFLVKARAKGFAMQAGYEKRRLRVDRANGKRTCRLVMSNPADNEIYRSAYVDEIKGFVEYASREKNTKITAHISDTPEVENQADTGMVTHSFGVIFRSADQAKLAVREFPNFSKRCKLEATHVEITGIPSWRLPSGLSFDALDLDHGQIWWEYAKATLPGNTNDIVNTNCPAPRKFLEITDFPEKTSLLSIKIYRENIIHLEYTSFFGRVASIQTRYGNRDQRNSEEARLSVEKSDNSPDYPTNFGGNFTRTACGNWEIHNPKSVKNYRAMEGITWSRLLCNPYLKSESLYFSRKGVKEIPDETKRNLQEIFEQIRKNSKSLENIGREGRPGYVEIKDKISNEIQPYGRGPYETGTMETPVLNVDGKTKISQETHNKQAENSQTVCSGIDDVMISEGDETDEIEDETNRQQNVSLEIAYSNGGDDYTIEAEGMTGKFESEKKILEDVQKVEQEGNGDTNGMGGSMGNPKGQSRNKGLNGVLKRRMKVRINAGSVRESVGGPVGGLNFLF
ncbi:hypothetical protein BGW36DRAFT_355300 [Talaromyces proteolyticus]|uniref:RRM domain-containing protein n=1 Tax=Talaromyces proteolyticus TaxID=1131652 RepID=A0AAD4L1P1_9EURO|nr:uncharacterized protein BGW36DRAFT_355300 [Talaromyces proteolyticus]KAH8703905.1 hypothetical protein BGW36DRAFT_355300 [Talaromyces proteolyticus]